MQIDCSINRLGNNQYSVEINVKNLLLEPILLTNSEILYYSILYDEHLYIYLKMFELPDNVDEDAPMLYKVQELKNNKDIKLQKKINLEYLEYVPYKALKHTIQEVKVSKVNVLIGYIPLNEEELIKKSSISYAEKFRDGIVIDYQKLQECLINVQG